MNTIPNGERITPRQYAALLTGAAFGSGILTLPRYLCEAAGQDGWVIPLLAGSIMCLSGLIFLTLCRRHPAKSLPEILRAVFPAPIANVGILCYLLFFLIVAASSIRMVAEVTLLYLLPSTPLWAVSLVYSFFIFYALAGGTRSVGRFNELTIFLLLFGFLLLLPSLGDGQLTNLSPVLSTSPKKLFSAVPIACYSFGISALIPVFLPYTDDRKRAVRRTWGALLFVLAAFTLVSLIAVVVLGADTVSHMLFPVITIYKSISVPVIERLDLFFLTLWTVLAVRPCLNYALATTRMAKALFGKLPTGRGMAGIFAVLLFLLMLLQTDIVETIRILHWLGYVYFALGIVLPLIGLIRSRKEPVPCRD